MKPFFETLLTILLFPVFFVISAAVFVFATLLWLPLSCAVLICMAFSLRKRNWISDLGEFIFLCYGFCLVLLMAPFHPFDNTEDF